MITTTATDIQNNFGKYLKAVQEGNEIISDKMMLPATEG